MMLEIIALLVLISFSTVFFLAPSMKKFLERIGLVGIDQQKSGKPAMATSGGILVACGILAGGFFFIGANSFILKTPVNLPAILAAYVSIMIITIIGFMDDINITRKPIRNKGMEDYRLGLRQWQKPLLTLPAAIPLMAISAGVTSMSLPLLGRIEFGIIYPIILIPLAVVVVSNTTNMLAGMNGLEAGLGFVSMTALGTYAFLNNRPEAAVLAFSLAFSLLAFLKWNWIPARFLPGDSLTYLIGATFASVVIIGNMERFGIIVFTPWIIEFFLKVRSRFSARSLGTLSADGTLKSPYKKTYSLTHFFMKLRPMSERGIALSIMSFEVIVCLLALMFF